MMKKWFVLLFTIIRCTLSLSACKQEELLTDKSTEESEVADEIPTSIMVGNREFSVDEINAGIINVFNNELYYHGDHEESEYMYHNKNLVLNQNIEYELYYSPFTGDSQDLQLYGCEILLVMPEIEHPLSQPDDIQIYQFGVGIREEGMGSGFSSGYRTYKDTYKSFLLERGYVYLGRHSMCIEEIVPPVYEEKSEEWKNNTEKSIQLYMDENDFYSDENKNLKPGKYKVYVKNFTKVALDSWIIFEHENGDVYYGIYYNIHNQWPNSPANLNHVEL